MLEQRAFTSRYPGQARVLHTKVSVCLPVTTDEASQGKTTIKEYTAIWDTGATSSAITKRVVEDLGLMPTGLAEVRHAKGISSTNTYLVNIALPSKVMYGQVRVTEVDLIPDDNTVHDNQPQILIGMDVIGSGDFAVTNFAGKTVLSFTTPSARVIDFIPEADRNNLGGTRQERRVRERELKKLGLR